MGQNHGPSESFLANCRETYSKSVIYRRYVEVKDGKIRSRTNQGRKPTTYTIAITKEGVPTI
jgi:hypothetical protein